MLEQVCSGVISVKKNLVCIYYVSQQKNRHGKFFESPENVQIVSELGRIYNSEIYRHIIDQADPVETHVHSNFSDGRAGLEEIIQEFFDLGLPSGGISDHVNGLDEDKNYSPRTSVVESRDLEFLSSGVIARYNSGIGLKQSDDEVIRKRYGDNGENVRRAPGRVEIDEKFWQEIPMDQQGLMKVILSLRQIVVDEWLEEVETELGESDVFNQRYTHAVSEDLENFDEDLVDFRHTTPDNEIPVLDFSTGIELDWNPPLGIEKNNSKREKRQLAEGYASELQDFLDYMEQPDGGMPHDVNIDHVIGSVHDVNIDYKPRYVKKDENFQDLNTEELIEVVDTYFEKLYLMMDHDNIFDKLAHPSLIERNQILMNAVSDKAEEDLDKEIKNRLYLEAEKEHSFYSTSAGIPEYGVEEIYDFKMKNMMLRDYYRPLISKLKNSTITPEINGKGLERQETPSEFWHMILEEDIGYEIGSDSHREKEILNRRTTIA